MSIIDSTVEDVAHRVMGRYGEDQIAPPPPPPPPPQPSASDLIRAYAAYHPNADVSQMQQTAYNAPPDNPMAYGLRELAAAGLDSPLKVDEAAYQRHVLADPTVPDRYKTGAEGSIGSIQGRPDVRRIGADMIPGFRGIPGTSEQVSGGFSTVPGQVAQNFGAPFEGASEGIRKIPTGGGTNLGQRIDNAPAGVRVPANFALDAAPYAAADFASGGALSVPFLMQAGAQTAQVGLDYEMGRIDGKTALTQLALSVGPIIFPELLKGAFKGAGKLTEYARSPEGQQLITKLQSERGGSAGGEPPVPGDAANGTSLPADNPPAQANPADSGFLQIGEWLRTAEKLRPEQQRMYAEQARTQAEAMAERLQAGGPNAHLEAKAIGAGRWETPEIQPLVLDPQVESAIRAEINAADIGHPGNNLSAHDALDAMKNGRLPQPDEAIQFKRATGIDLPAAIEDRRMNAPVRSSDFNGLPEAWSNEGVQPGIDPNVLAVPPNPTMVSDITSTHTPPRLTPDPHVNPVTEAATQAADIKAALDEHTSKGLAASPFFKQAVEVLGLPRAAQATLDLSAALRQGIVGAVGHPQRYAQAFKAQIQAFFSHDFAQSVHDTITSHPLYDMVKDRVDLTSLPEDATGALTKREEQFQSRLLEKIPGIGRLVKGSDRAFSTFTNKFRHDLAYDAIQRYIDSNGHPPTEKWLDNLGNYVNNLTGRGNTRVLGEYGAGVNAAFFSPKFLASRGQLIADIFRPSQSPEIRMMAAKDVGSFVASGVGVLAAMKVAGINVQTDPRSTDFGKYVVGGQHHDFWAGFGPIARAIAQAAPHSADPREWAATAGQRVKPSHYGNVVVDRDFAGILTGFLRTKLSPPASLGVDWSQGTQGGKDVNFNSIFSDNPKTGFLQLDKDNPVIQRMAPLFLQDAVQMYQQDGLKGLAGIPQALLGESVTAYEPSQKSLEKTDKIFLKQQLPEQFGKIESDTYRDNLAKLKVAIPNADKYDSLDKVKKAYMTPREGVTPTKTQELARSAKFDSLPAVKAYKAQVKQREVIILKRAKREDVQKAYDAGVLSLDSVQRRQLGIR